MDNMVQLTTKQKQVVMHGANKRVQGKLTTKNGEGSFNTLFDGVVNWLERTLKETSSERRKTALAAYYAHTPAVAAMVAASHQWRLRFASVSKPCHRSAT